MYMFNCVYAYTHIYMCICLFSYQDVGWKNEMDSPHSAACLMFLINLKKQKS